METRGMLLSLAGAALALGLPAAGSPRVLQDTAAAGKDPYALVQEAKALLDAHRYDRVLEIVDGLLAEYPDSPSSHLLRAMALDELGRLDEAEKSYEAALRSAPDEPQILARFGIHFLRREAWKKAIPHLERSLKAGPDAVSLFYLAQAYFNADQKARSIEAIEQAAALSPENPTILLKLGEYRAQAGKHSPALEALLRAQELNPDEPGLDLALGNVLLRLLEVEKAREALERARQQEPENPAVLAGLAEACSKARDHSAARRYYRKLLDLGHDDAEYHLGLGAALVGLGENEAAIASLNEAVKRNPRLEQAHFHLARAYQSAGRTGESRRELGLFKALKASPFAPLEDRSEFERKLWREAEALVKEGREEEALRRLAGGNAPGNEPEFLVGALYYWQGRYDDAERLLAEAMERATDIPNLRTYLGLTHLKQGRLAEAESEIAAERAENPRDALVLMAMGELGFVKKNWADAVRYLEESRIVDTHVLLMLCEAQLESGDRESARETAQLITALAAGDERVRAAVDRLLARYEMKLETDPGPAAEAAPWRIRADSAADVS